MPAQCSVLSAYAKGVASQVAGRIVGDDMNAMQLADLLPSFYQYRI